jgi:aminopeptidase N
MPTVLALAALLFASSSLNAQFSPADLAGPGVSLALAEDRARRVSDLRYELSLTIPGDLETALTGAATLRLHLTDASTPLVLDFDTSRAHIGSLTVNGRATPIDFEAGHIILPSASLAEGANEIRIAFTAGDAPLNRNAEFLYALFVPARARQAIPVFDQPDLKARWTLSLTVPAAWQAVGNGEEVGRSVSDDTATVRFAETEPLSTYLFSFVAGDFRIETASRSGRVFRMFHRETDADKVARNREAIFDLHASALDYMERYTDLPYAFGKFDFVLIPAFQFGGMEHAGKILYNAQSLLLDESATQNQYLGRASVIAHETAHMWFGNLVTMQWFNDVWMKEVFANFMAAKIVNPSFPEVNHDLRFLLAHYPAAYGVDRTGGANPIRQPLANLDEAGSLYGAIIYQKAPIVMRHLEDLIGEVRFRDGLRDYLERYAFGNATWSDLISILDERTPMDLVEWSRVWVETFGRPVITTDLEVSDGRITRLALRQRDYWERSILWPQQLRVAIGDGDGVRILNVALHGAEAEVPEAVGLPAPQFVLPNGEGWAYGAIALDPASLTYLSSSLPAIPDALTRGAAWVTMWEALLEQGIRPAAFVDLAIASVAREPDELNRQRVLGYLGAAWWRYLAGEEREARVATLERTLRDGLARAETASQKSAWFSALRDVAATPDTIGWLRKVAARTETVPGLPLAEDDYATLALELAVREVGGWHDLLTEEHARIENPDRKARFAFVMPALSADPATREGWFDSLKDIANRRREPWVLEGLSYLHHPLRASASARFIEPALDMLWEIQKTGDIFFPKRWLDQTFSGHSSVEAAGTIERFLERLPASYPPRLKQIILQSADDTFRAATILGR